MLLPDKRKVRHAEAAHLLELVMLLPRRGRDRPCGECVQTQTSEIVMTRDEVYHADPEIMGGTPVFKGTRVPVQTLLDYLEGGATLDEFLDGFPGVSREQAIAFLELAKNALLTTA
jgi:uncharacterized protein (DUF433 family)